jgi:hypothetical protein
MIKLDHELKRMGIDIDDPKFDIKKFEVPNPRPPKQRGWTGPPPVAIRPP